MNARLMINSPAESAGVAQPKGWMNSDFFSNAYFYNYLLNNLTRLKSPVLLILDGRCSHKTLEVINLCRENHIHLISSPPHTTHKLQPLDRTFMKPFKDAYNQRCDMWMRANAGSRITDHDIAGLVNKAFTKVVRLDIAVSGFKCTGIHPFDRHLFSDLDYLPSNMTKILLEEPETSLNASSCSKEVSVTSTDLTLASSLISYDNLVSEETTTLLKKLPMYQQLPFPNHQ
ncbi:unnamed protein product [Arctia plantaginis]|uniref:DDE-1 domain-containing protein n=1 Tax=Arctia plantaginis TaxID=874455 RepID=A0A8S0YNP7_ARCPL|nr:unnamed protein product [Arctia plantaginis]